jgi:hypothetical protein
MPFKFTTILLTTLLALSKLSTPTSTTQADLDTRASWLTGSFSSQDQAAGDTNYYDIRLEMVPIWTDHPNGRWFYVEQASRHSSNGGLKIEG